ncbi:spliced leader RNA PSE-promoter transcription factor [Strigomonas culicis]|uniref:Spliced leader RNA PSE-promoter transcription factor n=1 Tax=Strigomonas culicis TaxID=28005 RepID=S9UQL9_9TRYP|nr:spliced leader RNA PSE-promoter transcription factor [Strigomonas culicis]|eukprot:EPY33202.1 spliced leader RNA PSE-promoter transcription factor [Strigomonas culicis]
MLGVCEREELFDETHHFCPAVARRLAELLRQYKTEASQNPPAAAAENTTEVPDGGRSSPFYNTVLSPRRAVARVDVRGGGGLTVRDVDEMWDVLGRTPLNSPVHGFLAVRGKARVDSTITGLAYGVYPRLRSKHLQKLLHETSGLLPCGRIAVRLGFADVANVSPEIHMWRELNVLQNRLDEARKRATAHLQRMEKGVPQQRRWYWRSVLRSASGRLKLFPVDKADLLPRLEWVRDSLYAFVAFLELAEASGDTHIDTEVFIRKVFCSQLGTFAFTRNLYAEVESALKVPGANLTTLPVMEAMQVEYDRVMSLSQDTKDVLNEKVHPLNDLADRRRAQFESSGGAHATQSLRDDLFDEVVVEKFQHLAPPQVLHALETGNALKEAQLILRYAPGINPALRHAPIDVDQVVSKTVEVHQTNNYASLHDAQQYRTVEYTVCRLFAGKHCIGEGKGEHLMEAIQQAGQSMLFNYYLHKDMPGIVSSSGEEGEAAVAPLSGSQSPSRDSKIGTVRMREPQVQENISF